MSNIPVIGIMMDGEDKGSFSRRPYYALDEKYFAAIVAAGGLPLGIPYAHNLLDTYLKQVDGILIPGGDYQFPPEWYVDGFQSKFSPNVSRQKFELDLIERLLLLDTPLLGICCGMQVMAVAGGCKLTSELPKTPINHRPEDDTALIHTLKILPDTRLSQIAGSSMRANSCHYEGVAEAGALCRISAIAEDGVIEAIEFDKHRFALGVQWHPELNLDDEKNFMIFRRFVDACRSNRPL